MIKNSAILELWEQGKGVKVLFNNALIAARAKSVMNVAIRIGLLVVGGFCLLILFACDSNNESASDYLSLARSSLEAGDTSQAIIHLQDGLQKYPPPAAAGASLAHRLANIYANERRYSDLIRFLTYSQLDAGLKSIILDDAADDAFKSEDWPITIELYELSAEFALTKQIHGAVERNRRVNEPYELPVCNPRDWFRGKRNAAAAAYNYSRWRMVGRIVDEMIMAADKCSDDEMTYESELAGITYTARQKHLSIALEIQESARRNVR